MIFSDLTDLRPVGTSCIWMTTSEKGCLGLSRVDTVGGSDRRGTVVDGDGGSAMCQEIRRDLVCIS